MALRYDFAEDEFGSLAISPDGDFFFEQSDEQHIQDTINAWPGWWKEYPLDGVSVTSFLKGSAGLTLLARQIKVELNSDGYQCNNPIITLAADGTLIINPNVTIV